METQPSVFLGLLPMILFAVPTAIVANMLAREKERNVVLWTIVGAMPVIGFFGLWFFVGAANFRLEKKIDELLKRQGV
jgi:hypothetical protein